jgi:hypothetical protein
MTCQEFKNMVSLEWPQDRLASEIMAVMNHRNTCQACADWLEDECYDADQRLTAEDRIAVEIVAQHVVNKLSYSSEYDPEA